VAAQTTASVQRWTEFMYVLSKSSRVLDVDLGGALAIPGLSPERVARTLSRRCSDK
jgi:hypothetical protein